MNLRVRLALLYAGQLAIVLALALGFVYVVHSDSHEREVDNLLSRASKDLFGRLGNLDIGEFREFRLAPQLAADGHLNYFSALVLDAGGGVVATTGHDRGAEFAEAMGDLPAGYTALRIPNDHIRALVTPLGERNQRLVTTASLRGLDGALDRLRGQLVLISLAAIVLSFGLAVLVAARALRPVDQVAEAALTIAETRNFERRVPALRQRDKLGRLVRAFNLMLDAIEETHIQQRRFVSDVSHELRTPLTTIRGATELALAADFPVGDRDQALRHAREEAARLSRLVDDLLDLARADEGSEPLPEAVVELDDLLMDVFVDLRPRAGGRLSVRTIDPCLVRGSPDRLKQLLLIPLDNALRYTPAPGRVEMSLERRGTRAIVTIDDEGIGVSADGAARVFERFYRGDAAKQLDPAGSGLGLPIARWIAARHGGTIELAPRAPRGTRVCIDLPLCEEQTALRSFQAYADGARAGAGAS